MDTITIKNLRLRCLIGFNPDERREKQDVIITMELFTDIRRGGTSDDPADILNYKTVNKAVIRHVEASSYNTLEALATSIARVAIVDCGVSDLRVTVQKPHALRFTDDVMVTIRRTQSDFIP